MRTFIIALFALWTIPCCVFAQQTSYNTTTNSHALSFDGIDDYVQMMDKPAYKNLQELTVMLWVKNTHKNQMGTLVDCIDSCNTRGTWAFRAYKDRLRWFIGNEKTYNGKTKLPITTHQWQHYTFTFSDVANTLKIYLDGQLVATQTVDAQINSAATLLRIGNDLPSSGSLPFKGLLDEVKIWNKHLSPDQIQAEMYQMPHQAIDHLVGYWPFNEGRGTQSADQSSQQNHGLVHGASWTTDTPFANSKQNIPTSVSVYPNPIQRSATLQYTGTIPSWIEIVDANGRVLKRITDRQQITTYQFTSYPPGMYFLRYPNPKGVQNYKIIVE